MTPQLPSIKWIFEDEFIFAISKCAGCHSVKGEGPSLADALESARPELLEASPNSSDAGLVTRLDFETSGVILGAKTKNAWERMRDLAKKHLIEKHYEAIVEGKIQDSLVVDAHIGSKGRSAKKVRAFSLPPAKRYRALPALTTFSLLSYSQAYDASFVQAVTRYGRRHQVRAHSAFCGFPLLGDLLYGSIRSLPKEFMRPSFFLHGKSVSFIHPFTNEKLVISDPLAALPGF